MSHVRKQIRDRVAVLLAPVATTYKSRTYSIAEGVLPVLLVYTNSEEVEQVDFTTIERALQVVVEAVTQDGSDLDDALDDLIAGTETAIATDPTMGGKAMDCNLASIEVTVSTEGAQPIGRARLTFVARYRTTAADPETAT
jgi:hypothetical protein